MKLLKIFGVIAILLVSLLVACSNSSSSAATPDFVGSWLAPADLWGPGTGTPTLTLAETTAKWTVVGGTYNGGVMNSGLVVDQTAKHMTMTLSGSPTGPAAFVSQFNTIPAWYATYSVAGSALDMAFDTVSFPPTATSGTMVGTLTKQ